MHELFQPLQIHGYDPAYLNRPVRIINQDGGGTLYAHTGADWEVRVGAGPNSQVTTDGHWLILHAGIGIGYITVNLASHPFLYARRDGNWQTRFGAGLAEDFVTE